MVHEGEQFSVLVADIAMIFSEIAEELGPNMCFHGEGYL